MAEADAPCGGHRAAVRFCARRCNAAPGRLGKTRLSKRFAAGLEMRCPGGVLSQTASLKSQSVGRWQRPSLRGAGPPLGHEAAPGRAVLRRGLIAICATCRHGRRVRSGRNETRVLSLMSAFQVKSGTGENPHNRSGRAERSGRLAAASVMEPTPAKPGIKASSLPRWRVGNGFRPCNFGKADRAGDGAGRVKKALPVGRHARAPGSLNVYRKRLRRWNWRRVPP